MVVEPLKPTRGGYQRPFGCGEFIREFLLGHGPWGSPKIDPEVGACQADIYHFYKLALIRASAEDFVAQEEEERIVKGIPPFSVEEADERTRYYLERIPYKLTHARFHSFVVYFSNLQRLGWVEFTGVEEKSQFQDHYASGPPRRYFRLTEAGKRATNAAWSNPLFALYGENWGPDYLRELRKRRKYTRKRKK